MIGEMRGDLFLLLSIRIWTRYDEIYLLQLT